MTLMDRSCGQVLIIILGLFGHVEVMWSYVTTKVNWWYWPHVKVLKKWVVVNGISLPLLWRSCGGDPFNLIKVKLATLFLCEGHCVNVMVLREVHYVVAHCVTFVLVWRSWHEFAVMLPLHFTKIKLQYWSRDTETYISTIFKYI